MDRYILRRARQEDCKEILRLIQELANHEKKGEHVNITKESEYSLLHFKRKNVLLLSGSDIFFFFQSNEGFNLLFNQ